MSSLRRSSALAGILVAGAGIGGLASAQGGVGGGSSGTGTVGTGTVGAGTIITATSPGPTPVGPPTAASAEQTHPRALPRTGGRRTHFTVRLTLAQAPGHSGVLAVAYGLELTPPAGRSFRRCGLRAPVSVDAGVAHQVVRIALGRPVAGWCSGRYTVDVFLRRGPYCPRPELGRPPTPCPLFAEQELKVGTAHFTVSPRH